MKDCSSTSRPVSTSSSSSAAAAAAAVVMATEPPSQHQQQQQKHPHPQQEKSFEMPITMRRTTTTTTTTSRTRLQQQKTSYKMYSSSSSSSLSFLHGLSFAMLLLFFSCGSTFCAAEVRHFEGLLLADSTYIHYSEGFLVAPGYIDLTGLVFSTLQETDENYNNNNNNNNDGLRDADADAHDDPDDDDVTPPDGGRNRERSLWFNQDQQQQQQLQQQQQQPALNVPPSQPHRKTTAATPTDTTSITTTTTTTSTTAIATASTTQHRAMATSPATSPTTEDAGIIDVVFFHEPSACANSRRVGCDWTALGIGASDDMGSVRWCCSEDAIVEGYCAPNLLGRLIVNATRFTGQHRFLSIPAYPTVVNDRTISFGKLEETTVSGTYVLVMANCNDTPGRNVQVAGQYVWKSKDGYLPGDLFGEAYFFVTLWCIYTIVGITYAYRKTFLFPDASIPIQNWVLGTIALGWTETLFRSMDYFIWNTNGGNRWYILMYFGVLVGVIKRGLSRCLILSMSLGWGVVRDSLDSMKLITSLGIAYCILAAIRDIMTIVAVTENEVLSAHTEVELFDVVTIITFCVAAIDVTFYMWILDALNGTMQYLENMNQRMKLQRYLTLRCILMFSILFAVMWSVFSIVNTYMDTAILEQQNEWAIGALMELNYLSVLCGVAYLWRPHPNAKDLAYVMELPALGGNHNMHGINDDDDDDDFENELEMTETVPSAVDDDDDDNNNHEEEFVAHNAAAAAGVSA